ncbi:outer membrane protein assembly factor BamE [Neptunomonas marina]|uniref:Outer membrane protein assembly factor BamE n=1 Tax=Neptunomonas marina TaxID=1815562 RepID=A0A437QAJ4_9GAMM|nr:outer membrane protein assembly factor BamE [Neptunomonas marina]RVU31429.1 outer membrane protein assembly factor BamE [Neptunomonas marina]
MRKVLISIIAATVISGCSEFPGVYKIDIPQGNIVTQEMVDQLRPGMNHNQVRYVLGTPLITDTFHDGRWDYIYTIKKGNGDYSRERFSVFFEQGKLVKVSGDYRPSPSN